MTCREVRRRLPGYLDGALSAADHASARLHLEACATCRQELERYRRMSQMMAQVEQASPPADLALRVRVRVAALKSYEGWARRMWSRAAVRIENFIEPLAVPATGGVMTALLVFAFVVPSLLVGVPVGAVPNDVPTSLMQDARLESLARFPFLGGSEWNGVSSPSLILVEATVDARGQAAGYEILAGPDGQAVRRQLDQLMLFSRFRPQMTFGRPTSGGRVRMVLTFSEIRVRG